MSVNHVFIQSQLGEAPETTFPLFNFMTTSSPDTLGLTLHTKFIYHCSQNYLMNSEVVDEMTEEELITHHDSFGCVVI